MDVKDLKKHFLVETGSAGLISKRTQIVHAVDGISFSIASGQTFGLVGETGSGKTTTAKLILRLIEPTSGEVLVDGQDVLSLGPEELRNARRNMQMIFQDPFASLNPRASVGDIVGLPLEVHGIAEGQEKRKIVIDILRRVGLTPAEQLINRHPHEFSGGQRQRIGIARALVLKPKFILADEPVSALDMSIRSQILNLMQDLQVEMKLTYLLIAHDLSVVRHMSDRVAVMYLGRIVECADTEDFFKSARHPYSQSLIAAIPVPDPTVKKERVKLRGEMPSPIHMPRGCRFQTRCPFAKPECRESEPELFDIGNNHLVSCYMVKW